MRKAPTSQGFDFRLRRLYCLLRRLYCLSMRKQQKQNSRAHEISTRTVKDQINSHILKLRQCS